jgi:hypothetical protein
VSVLIDRNKEIVEEIEQKDALLGGVYGLMTRRSRNHEKTLVRELERAFFKEASDNAAVFAPAGTLNPAERLEALIQRLENTKNEYVDGVDRDMLAIIMNTAEYGKIRNFLDFSNNSNVDTAAERFGMFHGVRIFPTVYLPADTGIIGMAEGSVALPCLPRPYKPEQIPLSDAFAVSLFFYYGVKAVTPDLLVKTGVA